jgi:hypothetical protein
VERGPGSGRALSGTNKTECSVICLTMITIYMYIHIVLMYTCDLGSLGSRIPPHCWRMLSATDYCKLLLLD